MQWQRRGERSAGRACVGRRAGTRQPAGRVRPTLRGLDAEPIPKSRLPRGVTRGKLTKVAADVRLNVFVQTTGADDETARLPGETARQGNVCGNGEHENPELEVVELIARSRLADGTDRPFKLWFNSSPAVATNQAHRDHLQAIVDRVADIKAQSNGRLCSFFLEDSSFDLAV